jgi:hypothetical protein
MGLSLYDRNKKTNYIAEGPWDGMALWQELARVKQVNGELKPAIDPASSLLRDANVIAVPGCNVFFDSWGALLAGSKTFLLFDNDHPRKHPQTGNLTPGPGYLGMERAVRTLALAAEQPASVGYLCWGKDGYDPQLPDGHDVRDVLTGVADAVVGPEMRPHQIQYLFDLLKPVPSEWTAGAARKGSVAIECLPCRTWAELKLQWRKALSWTPGLNRALSVMLASITSTESVGEQLWIKVIGAPSSGKTTLAEALGVARKYVLPKDTFTGLTSGYQTDKDGTGENLSLVTKLRGKTLIINDGDTLLQLPNRAQILSQLRAFYSRNLRSSYGNKMSADHEGYNTTIIICGTEALRLIDDSELGQRTLDCTIPIDEATELEILWRVANREERNLGQLSDGKVETRFDEAMVKAMRLTGGYVEYLRGNAQRLLAAVTMSDEVKHRCITYGRFVAFMRARPSKRQDEVAEKEFAARLVAQLIRLAKCLAVVHNWTEVDEEVMTLVRQVALDTARGNTFRAVRAVYRTQGFGCSVADLAATCYVGEDRQRTVLLFLKRLGVLTTRLEKKGYPPPGRTFWVLTPTMSTLYRKVVANAGVANAEVE